MDPPPEYEPLRRYIAVYKIGGELRLSHIAFDNQIAAWTKPRGPNVPKDIEIVDVIDVRYPQQNSETAAKPLTDIDR
jgi:hypothetical protein